MSGLPSYKGRVYIPSKYKHSFSYHIAYFPSICLRAFASITLPENIIRSTLPKYRERVRKYITFFNSSKISYKQKLRRIKKITSHLPFRRQVHRLIFETVEKNRQYI